MITQNARAIIIGLFLSLADISCSFSQSFINLNFESEVPSVFESDGLLPASNAIPGWTAYISGISQEKIEGSEVVSVGNAKIILEVPGNVNGFPAIQGNFSVVIWGQYNAGNPNTDNNNTAAIGQTGQIPSSLQFISFCGSIGNMYATFNGQPLAFVVTGSTATYNIYSANASSFAGQTGQLLFTDNSYANFSYGPAQIDNIQFSSSDVPESQYLSLFGACIFTIYCWIRLPNKF